MRWVRGTLLVAVFAGVVHACTSADPQGPTATPDAGSQYGASPCAACARSVCASEHDACETEPECGSTLACANACPVATNGSVDASCLAACGQPNASVAASYWTTLQTCVAESQCEACGWVPSNDAAPENPILKPQNCPPSNLGGCDGCLEDNCCQLMDACLNDTNCTDLVKCASNCADWPCEAACNAQYPDGVLPFALYLGCSSAFCPGQNSGCNLPTESCGYCRTAGACKLPWAECLADLECYDVYSCSLYCTDATCLVQCQEGRPKGGALFGTLTACWQNQCATC